MVALHKVTDDSPTYDEQTQAETRDRFAMMTATVFERLAGDGDAMAVYIALAQHANKEGECWPSIATLCRLTGYSDKHVRGKINRLVELSIIAKSPRSVGGMKSVNIYRICQKSPELQIGMEYRTSGTTNRTDRYGVPDRAVPGTDRTRTSELEPIEPENTPLPPKGEVTPKKRGKSELTDMPPDFEVTEEMRAYARTKYGIDDDEITDRDDYFRNYVEQNGKQYKNWVAAWKNAMGWEQRGWSKKPKPVDRSDWPLPEPFRLRWQMFQDERTGMGHPPAEHYPATLQADIEHWRATGEVRMLRPIRAVAS